MAKLLTRYHAQLTAQPALTKFSTGVVVFALGDIGCQYGVESVPLLEVDIVRTSRAAVFGGLFSLWLHGWWNFLERAGHRIAPVATRGTLLNASFKVFCDQTFSATLFNAGYIAAANAKPGATVGSVWGCVVAQTPSQMLLHWKYVALRHTRSLTPCLMSTHPHTHTVISLLPTRADNLLSPHVPPRLLHLLLFLLFLTGFGHGFI